METLLIVIGDLEVERRKQIATIQALSHHPDAELIREAEGAYETPVGCAVKITPQANGNVEIEARSAITGQTSKVVANTERFTKTSAMAD